jgi:hypothetical protein
MRSGLDLSVEELLEVMEEFAATGDDRAEWIFQRLLEDEAKTGELHDIHRIMCSHPYVHVHDYVSERGIDPAVWVREMWMREGAA